jgi:serine/threonine protein kinase
MNIDHPLRQSMIHRLLSLSSEDNEKIPSALFIRSVLMKNDDAPVAGGSFADVFRGTYLGQDVAVKRFRVFLPSDCKKKLYKVCWIDPHQLRCDIDPFSQRFYREALIWRQLKHPNILGFLGVDQDALHNKGSLCMVCPWMAKGTLMEYLGQADLACIIQHRLLVGVPPALLF